MFRVRCAAAGSRACSPLPSFLSSPLREGILLRAVFHAAPRQEEHVVQKKHLMDVSISLLSSQLSYVFLHFLCTFFLVFLYPPPVSGSWKCTPAVKQQQSVRYFGNPARAYMLSLLVAKEDRVIFCVCVCPTRIHGAPVFCGGQSVVLFFVVETAPVGLGVECHLLLTVPYATTHFNFSAGA